jgi:alkanesulfonate monooxygenase SsuD/methylene tetrahydromethanopterin reductase-like flavin-dependent oxidoreductase (luciferase family)
MFTWVDDDASRAERVLVDVLAPLVRRHPEELRGRVCVGTVDQCAALLADYAGAGCRRVYVWPLGDEPDQLRRVVEEVLPAAVA